MSDPKLEQAKETLRSLQAFLLKPGTWEGIRDTFKSSEQGALDGEAIRTVLAALAEAQKNVSYFSEQLRVVEANWRQAEAKLVRVVEALEKCITAVTPAWTTAHQRVQGIAGAALAAVKEKP